ncbi:hypothetical protein CISIN_1g016367mg [Citrus sinensis]|uniref:F-box domain-containing protein n=1 Tax=Citrus sinensis TaxID=2711 RepID=A0A067E6Q2_CITSI|nr:hypothetical protein CISIN_1g016367mg [Citrus sinensis]
MENLPLDVALDILSRLPITALVRTKCVCRTWQALAQDPRLPIIYHARASTRDPCLILHYDSPIQNKLCFVSINGDNPDQDGSRVRRIDARVNSIMAEYQVVGSCNGLLCVSDALYFNPIIVCNPFTGSYLELAKATQHAQEELAFGFGCNSSTMEYKVVRIVFNFNTYRSLRDRGWPRKSDVEVLTVGIDHTWRYLGPVPWRLNPGASEALLNGSLHWVTMRYKNNPGPRLRIMSFDLAEEDFGEIGLPDCGSLSVCNFHLVVLRGCLSAVHCLDDKGMEIWIMKEYKVRESWSKDYIIGTYLPASLRENARPHLEMLKKSGLGRGSSQVVCDWKNGEILLEYANGALVSYNPENEELKDLVIFDPPKWFCSIVHVESLFLVEAILGIGA